MRSQEEGRDGQWTRSWSIGFAVGATAIALGLAVVGLMRPWMLPDTPGYLDPCSEGCLGGPRTPYFGWLVNALARLDPGLTGLPWIHYLSWAGSAWALMSALRSRGATAPTAMAVGIAVLASNMVLLWGRAVLPESLAHAALICAYAACIRRGDAVPRVVVAAALMGTAYLLKPGLTACAMVMPILVFSSEAGPLVRRLRLAVVVLATALMPFVAIASVRLASHGSFHIVSFSGFQMSGMAAMMLSPSGIARMPAAVVGDATAILAAREQAEASGAALPIPPNSSGVRSFHSVAAQYFDILARNHDAVLWGPVTGTRRDGESWVAFDARLQRLSWATVQAEREAYAAWLLGASSRLVGHMLVLNGIFMLACLGLAAWIITVLLRGRDATASIGLARNDVTLLAPLSLAHAAGAGFPAVALTFPAGRYIDSAALFLAAWPLAMLLTALMRGTDQG